MLRPVMSNVSYFQSDIVLIHQHAPVRINTCSLYIAG